MRQIMTEPESKIFKKTQAICLNNKTYVQTNNIKTIKKKDADKEKQKFYTQTNTLAIAHKSKYLILIIKIKQKFKIYSKSNISFDFK